MRILLYGINFSPELVGIGKYSGEMAAWFAKQGDEVWVITAPPYYPEWQVQAPYRASRFQSEQLDDKLSVLRCPLWVPAQPSGKTRILHLLSFALSSFLPLLWQAMRHRPDYIVVLEPPLFCAPMAWLAARLCAAKACLHVQDFEVDAAFDLGLLKSARLRRWVLAAERWMMQRFDKVFTISPRMLDKLYQKGLAQQDCGLFPNWVDTAMITPSREPNPFRQAWGIATDKIVLLYAGNIGAKQGLENVVQAAQKLRTDSRFVFVICGKGAFYSQLRELAQKVDNIHWHELQPLEKLNQLLNLADIHLLPQRADAADLVMPSKLTGMLASGKPVIATALPNTQVAEVVCKTGLVTPPGDVDALVTAILRLADDVKLRDSLGREARRYALTHLDKALILREFRQLLQAF